MAVSDDANAVPAFTVVIPVRDEKENIRSVVSEIKLNFAQRGLTSYEVIVVDDGSTDGTRAIVESLAENMPELRLLSCRSSLGQSGAVWLGVRAALAEWVGTIDGDGQNDPRDLWPLWVVAKEKGSQGRPILVIGARVKRRDSGSRVLTSWALNRLSAVCLRHEVLDKGSGIKVFMRRDFLALPRFDHMHRFLPALFSLIGGSVVSVPVNHRPRLHGSSHYKNGRRIREAVVDVLGIMWLQRRFVQMDADESGYF